LASFIVALGVAGGVMDLWYQVQATEMSEPKDRSMAMASIGLGWPLCLLVAPLLLGWMADMKGFKFTFVVAGIFFLLVAAGSTLWYLKTRSKVT
jgi:predicted MFS family arabinose efflux permease